jgi:hypothetical protein
MSLSSIMRSGHATVAASLAGRGGPARPASQWQESLAQAFRRQVGHGLVVVGGDEPGAGVDVERAEPVDDLLAQDRIGM